MWEHPVEDDVTVHVTSSPGSTWKVVILCFYGGHSMENGLFNGPYKNSDVSGVPAHPSSVELSHKVNLS